LRKHVARYLAQCAAIGALILAWPVPTTPAAGPQPQLPVARNLAQQAELNAREGRALLVLFSQHGCPWCERARREFLLPMSRNAGYRSRVAFLQVDVDSDRALRDFGGQATTHAAFARANGVRLYPTVVLFGPNGERLAEPLIGFTGSDFYGAYLDQRIEAALKNYAHLHGNSDSQGRD